MNVHASPNTLPELDDFLSTFHLKFRRSEGKAALERYLTGLLTELPNKNCDTMATAVPGASVFRYPGQGGQLPGRRDMLLRRCESQLASGGALVLAQRMGSRPRALAACPGA